MYHGSFCCVECHAAYMAQQHKKWSMPGTARGDGRVVDLPPIEQKGPLYWHRSPDYTVASDEAIGSWSIAVRTIEEFGST